MGKQPIISFRVDSETYEMVQKIAATRAESVGGFARETLLEGLGELTSQTFDIELLREEITSLKIQHAKGIELIARLICREDPNVHIETEEDIASWVQREIPR